MPSIRELLEQSRRDLLDLGVNHNGLLNHRTSRRVGVEVHGESTIEVYRQLVSDNKSMTFAAARRAKERTKGGRAESGEQLAISNLSLAPVRQPIASEDDDEEEVVADGDLAPAEADALTDRVLQTKYKGDALEARLRSTAEDAMVYIEEQGINVLYLALGMLIWKDHADEERRAPILLVPVELERAGVKAKFTLKWSGEDVGDNLSLREMLKAQHNIDLGAFDDEGDSSVSTYIAAVAAKIGHLDGWKVEVDNVVLGFFSFAKFLMHKDLDPENWPETAKPYDHPIIAGVLADGFHDSGSPIPPDVKIDQIRPAGEAIEVLDADSSQAAVLYEVERGRNLVIQGPPGTGKSQVITNLISAAVVAGKKVLFVAEKMAALEVVKRRMDAIGVGDCALELHSHKTRRREVIDELRRVLDLGQPVLDGLSDSVAELRESRDRLNSYCKAVSTPVGHSGKSPFQLMGLVLAIDERGPVPKLDFQAMKDWTADELTGRVAIVRELQLIIQKIGLPSRHPLYGVELTVVLPSDPQRIEEEVRAAESAVADSLRLSGQLAEMLALSPAAHIGDIECLIVTAEAAGQAPNRTSETAVTDDAWFKDAVRVHRLIKTIDELAAVHHRFDEQLITQAWNQDVLAARKAYAAYGQRLFRMLNGEFRRARVQVLGLCRLAPPATNRERLLLLDAIMKAQELTKTYEGLSNLGAKLFGALWQGLESTAKDMALVAGWLKATHEEVRASRLPNEVLIILGRGRPIASEVTALAAQTKAAIERAKSSVAVALGSLKVNAAKVSNLPLAALLQTLKQWRENVSKLVEYSSYCVLAKTCRERGVAEILKVADTWDQAGQRLEDCLRKTWLGGWLETAFAKQPEIAHFERTNHDDLVARFRKAENLAFSYHRARVCLHHWQSLPTASGGFGQLGVLRREVEKKSKHLPIRKLLTIAPGAVQSVKPVFMMSPMSVATYLTPVGPTFDIVVFDEASQVRPVDAFGALMRAKQVVVVGDSKQMPPTNFFSKAIDLDGDPDEYDDSAATVESILGLLKSRGVPERMLQWHYRSRHPSLIAVSNAEFYDQQLVVTPSPDEITSPGGAGLLYHHLPETAYDRGVSRTNVGEAKSVAEAVMRHARDHADKTLGVVAFSVAQKRAIEDEITKIRREDRTVDGFFLSHPTEPFFVKNLENVQGDERDVIFISIGYGKTVEGYLAMNFGPLSASGGERRLNVLISRARYRCEVFTNLTADDLDLERTRSIGVKSLRNFLRYAKDRRLDNVTVEPEDAFDSDFEEMVAVALRRAGYTVKSQVGTAGFRIDLGVLDDRQPGKYILGIECDGASYHSARWARDRDRLRQAVLQNMGWSIHRIWSTSWFRDRDRELRRLIEAVEQAKAGAAAPVANVAASASVRRDTRRTRTSDRSMAPYQVASGVVFMADGELRDAKPGAVATCLRRIVEVESPIHIEDLHRRFLSAAGAQRNGSKIQLAIEDGLSHAVRVNMVRRSGDFIWSVAMERPSARARQDGQARNISYVCDEEITEAILMVIEDSYGIDRDEAPRAAQRVLGFSPSPEGSARAASLIDQMVASGRVRFIGNQLRNVSSAQAV